MKELKELTLRELADEASRDIHSNLLEAGGKGLYLAVFKWLDTAIRWNEERKASDV